MWPFMTDEQWAELCAQHGWDPEHPGVETTPVKRVAFDLEEQTEDDFAAFLAEVEANENERIDKELEKEVEVEERVSKLRDSVEEQ
jgi:hypothetical protein